MTLVVDASVVVAALVDIGPNGQWAEAILDERDLYAPHLLPFEVSNVLRRLGIAQTISPDFATLAHGDFQLLHFDLIAHELLADRIWEHRQNLSAYDASYVAAAELLQAPLATLDIRLTKAPKTTCSFRTP